MPLDRNHVHRRDTGRARWEIGFARRGAELLESPWSVIVYVIVTIRISLARSAPKIIMQGNGDPGDRRIIGIRAVGNRPRYVGSFCRDRDQSVVLRAGRNNIQIGI